MWPLFISWFMVDGALESRELVNRSTYNAYPRYVIKGTKPPETQAPETQAPQTQTPDQTGTVTATDVPPQTTAPAVTPDPAA